MGFVIFFRWWYSAGWSNSFVAIYQRVQILAQELSMGILLRTLFEPWKQITLYGGPNAALDTKIHVLLDNIFSRVFGFVIRCGVLIIGAFGSLILFIAGILLAVIWPIVPLLPILFAFLAVRG